MIGLELKLVLAPATASAYFVMALLEGLPDGIRVMLDLAAIGVLLTGFLVLGRIRARAEAAEGAAAAWKLEREAAASRAERLEGERDAARAQLHDAQVTIAQLEARPTLESLEEEIRKLAALISSTKEATSPVDRLQ